MSKVQLSAEEAALNGAPEGELYLATVLERCEVQPPADPEAALEEILQQLGSRTMLKQWFEQFEFADKVRSVVLHAGDLINSRAAKEVRAGFVAPPPSPL